MFHPPRPPESGPLPMAKGYHSETQGLVRILQRPCGGLRAGELVGWLMWVLVVGVLNIQNVLR